VKPFTFPNLPTAIFTAAGEFPVSVSKSSLQDLVPNHRYENEKRLEDVAAKLVQSQLDHADAVRQNQGLVEEVQRLKSLVGEAETADTTRRLSLTCRWFARRCISRAAPEEGPEARVTAGPDNVRDRPPQTDGRYSGKRTTHVAGRDEGD